MKPVTAAPPADARRGSRAEQSAARRRRLLEAATELAADGGYDAVQMRDVAARADVALGTLYRHFSSKDQLLLAALAEQAGVLRDRLEQRPPRGSTPADRVADSLRRACHALERRPRVFGAMITAMSSTEAQAAAVKREVYDSLVTIVANAVDSDDHRDTVGDIDAVARVLGHVWYAALSFWVGGVATADQMADDLACAAHLLLDRS